MTITDPYTARDTRAAAAGLAFVSDNRCPLTLVGLPHIDSWDDPDIACLCTSRLNDHSATWRNIRTGAQHVIWEPYDVHGHALAQLVEHAETLGLRVKVSAESFWYPGRTVALVFTASGRKEKP